MAAGLPCISFDCPFGPADMITHDHDGLLIEEGSIDGMAGALSQLMGDAALRSRIGTQAESAAVRFAPAAIGDLWENTIRGALATARGQ